MKLTRLEMSGFKSFADTVTLDFERGVTAIVGPNGCGKSNVSDAVRWVLGEQSARLLRGGKMEDVIFQGAATRKPVNVAEVSLYLDNSDGQLAIAYQEVVITRRLSRSGQSDYLLNGQQVRLRDIQDLLRGTGLGSDAGVVIEAKMIELLLSDRAEERRSLFEEAAGIGLYRDRKQSTERRLAETAQDLQRVEDRINEAQTQVRSLARQKGKAERHQQLTQERFALEVTAAQRLTAHLAAEVAAMEARRDALASERPAARAALAEAETARDELGRTRSTAEAERTEIVRRLGDERGRLARLDGELKLAAERRGNLAAQRRRAEEERARAEAAARDAATEGERAAAERAAAEAEAARIRGELAQRARDEDAVRAALQAEREAVRQLELELQGHVQAARSLEGEREALTAELAQLRERAAHLATQRAAAEAELAQAERRRDHLVEQAAFRAQQARLAAETVQQARHVVNEVREHEAAERVRRRQAEELAAQLGARASALEELERDRVGLAPAAAALLAERGRFDGVVGPLSDFITIGRDGAELAERLLGDWMHAVLVRDAGTVAAIRQWHESQDPGTLMLLPLDPGPVASPADHPLRDRLHVEGPAAAWVDAILGGSALLDATGIAVRRANGAILLPGRGATTGPLRRRAELAAIRDEQRDADAALAAVDAALRATAARLADAEAAQQAAQQAADEAREAERLAVAAREDAVRAVSAASRELAAQALDAQRVAERVTRAEQRLGEVDAALAQREQERVRLDGGLGTARSTLQEREAAQESAREQRVHWQVQEAQVSARLQAAHDRAQRAARAGTEAAAVTTQMGEELARIAEEEARLAAQAAEWTDGHAQARVAVLELEAAASDSERALADAIEALRLADAAVDAARGRAEALSEEGHQLDLRLAEAAARRRSVVERLETTWRRPLDELLAGFEPLDLDDETLTAELARVVTALEAIGQVNPLAVEEHAEESKRLAFLVTQRDDLVAARQSLLQAIREIDGTARALFLETFAAVQAHFQGVFQTLFGGGECELRLGNPEEPLDCEIEIHAAPRGKRTQRIHLLSSGERTLVATSLLFAIYLTKPSPFCLMDEVDAPLDDANVGRFTRLLDEFKGSTQFIVITHNPRTMQAADAVYGVTMQEPGVSTIVGVRLGQAAGAA